MSLVRQVPRGPWLLRPKRFLTGSISVVAVERWQKPPNTLPPEPTVFAD